MVRISEEDEILRLLMSYNNKIELRANYVLELLFDERSSFFTYGPMSFDELRPMIADYVARSYNSKQRKSLVETLSVFCKRKVLADHLLKLLSDERSLLIDGKTNELE